MASLQKVSARIVKFLLHKESLTIYRTKFLQRNKKFDVGTYLLTKFPHHVIVSIETFAVVFIKQAPEYRQLYGNIFRIDMFHFQVIISITVMQIKVISLIRGLLQNQDKIKLVFMSITRIPTGNSAREMQMYHFFISGQEKSRGLQSMDMIIQNLETLERYLLTLFQSIETKYLHKNS